MYGSCIAFRSHFTSVASHHLLLFVKSRQDSSQTKSDITSIRKLRKEKENQQQKTATKFSKKPKKKLKRWGEHLKY